MIDRPLCEECGENPVYRSSVLCVWCIQAEEEDREADGSRDNAIRAWEDE